MLMHIDEKKNNTSTQPLTLKPYNLSTAIFYSVLFADGLSFYLMLKFFMNISRAFILQIFDMQSINKGAIRSGCANDFRSWYFLFNTNTLFELLFRKCFEI